MNNIESIAQDIIDARDLQDAQDVQWYVEEANLDEGTATAVYNRIIELKGF